VRGRGGVEMFGLVNVAQRQSSARFAESLAMQPRSSHTTSTSTSHRSANRELEAPMTSAASPMGLQ
jgi:hypothetical protein